MKKSYQVDKQEIDSLIQNLSYETLPYDELIRRIDYIKARIVSFRKTHLKR